MLFWTFHLTSCHTYTHCNKLINHGDISLPPMAVHTYFKGRVLLCQKTSAETPTTLQKHLPMWVSLGLYRVQLWVKIASNAEVKCSGHWKVSDFASVQHPILPDVFWDYLSRAQSILNQFCLGIEIPKKNSADSSFKSSLATHSMVYKYLQNDRIFSLKCEMAFGVWHTDLIPKNLHENVSGVHKME